MNNTLTSFVDFCKSVGRGMYEVWGDSTTQRSGGGHDEAFGKGIAGLAQCAGQITPCNTTSIFNDTMGCLESRRRNNASTTAGAVNDVGVDTNGYPVSMKQYGVQIPVPGAIAGASTWSGARVAYYAGTTVNMGGGLGASGDVTVADVAQFPNVANTRVRIENEVIKYASIVGNVLTGCTRGDLGTTAATHANGSVVGRCDNGPALASMLSLDRHPIGSGASFICTLFYMSIVDLTATPGAQVRQEIWTTPTFVNTDTTYTSKKLDTAGASQSSTVLGSASFAIGSIHAVDIVSALSPADLTSTVKMISLGYGTTATGGNGFGPSGPAAFMLQGIFEPNRPYGFVQSCGVSKGGKTLNQLLKTLRVYDATNTVCEYDKGLLSRRKLYIDSTEGPAGTARGGNGVAGLCKVVATGSNEASGSTIETALVDPTEAWTINVTTSLSVAIADATTTAAITLPATPASLGLLVTGGHILVGSERIIYTGVSGNTLTGITRGAYGTVGAAHAQGDAVYQGFNVQNPYGLATDLLFDYKLEVATWALAGGVASRFWYVWVRPFPQSSTSTVVADQTASSGAAQTEYKFSRFLAIVQQYLGGRDNFVIADSSQVFTPGEIPANDLSCGTDNIHMSDATYALFWHRYFNYDAVLDATAIKAPRGRN